jgi:hypothetical protein
MELNTHIPVATVPSEVKAYKRSTLNFSICSVMYIPPPYLPTIILTTNKSEKISYAILAQNPLN